jgi:hypothetical protein
MLFVTYACFAILILLAIAGESTLGLFNGDRDLAARAMKAIFALLGGVGFAFAQPTIWKAFAGFVQKLSVAGGQQSESRVAKIGLHPDLKQFGGTVGVVLCAVICIASCLLAFFLFRGKA